eukprot:1988773-Rhodomonas_salina.4
MLRRRCIILLHVRGPSNHGREHRLVVAFCHFRVDLLLAPPPLTQPEPADWAGAGQHPSSRAETRGPDSAATTRRLRRQTSAAAASAGLRIRPRRCFCPAAHAAPAEPRAQPPRALSQAGCTSAAPSGCSAALAVPSSSSIDCGASLEPRGAAGVCGSALEPVLPQPALRCFPA